MTTVIEGVGCHGRRKGLFWLAALALATPLVGRVGYRDLQPVLSPPNQPLAVAAAGDMGEIEHRAVDAFRRVGPSVVLVIGANGVPAPGRHAATPRVASGFVWDREGHVVTTYLAVRGATRARVRFANGRVRSAAVLGSAPQCGLAVLRIESKSREYQPVRLGSSEDLAVGQAVFALGSPFGLSVSRSEGLVSALRQRMPGCLALAKRGIIQTDAVINAGNAGGPLLDSAGRLVGVNIARVWIPGGNARVGFAVPVDLVKLIVTALVGADQAP
jgi:2-alkenal reductase